MKNRIKEIIVEQMEVDESDIKNESILVDDIGCDSLDLLELLMAFEEEYDLEISDAEADKIITVEDISKYLKRKGK